MNRRRFMKTVVQAVTAAALGPAAVKELPRFWGTSPVATKTSVCLERLIEMGADVDTVQALSIRAGIGSGKSQVIRERLWKLLEEKHQIVLSGEMWDELYEEVNHVDLQ